MDPPRLCFLPGSALPLSRPAGRHQLPCISAHALQNRQSTRASAAENAQAASDLLANDVGSGPAVTFGAMSLPLRAVVSVFAVTASAALAFTATPARGPSRPIAAASAAVVIAGTGTLALRKSPSKAARKYLAAALAELGVESPELVTKVKLIPQKFGVSDEDFVEMRRTLYEYYLLAMIDNPAVSFSEISHLTHLKHGLSLSGSIIGDAHFESCRAFYRNNVVFLEIEDDDVAKDTSQKKLDKLVFLSDRMYSDKDTDEAYRYEKSRLLKFFSMTNDDYQDRFSRVALPFYKDVIKRACVDSAVKADDIVAAQATLGVRDIDVERIHADSYADRIDSLVSKKGKLEQQDNDNLARIRQLLSINEDRASNTLKSLAEPIFRGEVLKALDSVVEGKDSMASIYGRLALRQSELSFPNEAANAAMTTEMTGRGVEIIRIASKFLRVQNVNSCIKQLGVLLKYVDNIIGLMRVSRDDLKDDVAIVQAYIPDVAKGLSKVEPKQMYRLYLSRCLEDRQISSEEEIQLTKLRAVLNVTSDDAFEAFNLAAGPVYRKAVNDAVKDGTFSEDLKSNITSLRGDLSIPQSTWKSIELDIYHDRLRDLVEGNRIIQEQEAQDLHVFREFLGLTPEDTASVHKSTMGPVYEQSVTEAMGATGIMLDEYRSGLERLRDRLGLTEDDADQSFQKVVKQRMLIYVNRAMSQLEKRQAVRGQNEQRDVGDDPNIKRAGAFLGIDAGGLPIELSNLVDFYVRNGLVKDEEVEVDGEKKTVQKYPVNLREDIDEKVYNELYKQYVIQCFSAQTRGEKQRLFAALDQLGSILGMNEDEVGKIHSGIGTVIYKNYVNQALLKGPLEDKDDEFLTNIQKMLSMKEEQCVKLLKDGKDNRVSMMLERIFAQPKVLPETIKRMRALASALEVDIVKDLSISVEQRGKMFNVEIDAAIDTGALTAENQGLIAEVQGGLQVPDDDAKEILLTCIQRRTLSHLVQASASLRQNRSESAVSEVKAMLRYGKLLPAKVKAPAVSSQEKQELYLLYQADVITDGKVDDASREHINLLKTLFGFTDADLEAVV